MKVLLLGSNMNLNLEHYTYINLTKLGNEVLFCGYRDKIGRMAEYLRMGITRSNSET